MSVLLRNLALFVAFVPVLLECCDSNTCQASEPALSIRTTVVPEKETPLIPRKVLFGNPDKAAARISPNGKWLSYLAPSMA